MFIATSPELVIGAVVEIIDQVDLESKNCGTIKLIEPDNELADLTWLYIRANDESLNVNYDSRIGYFWRIIESVSPYLSLIA